MRGIGSGWRSFVAASLLLVAPATVRADDSHKCTTCGHESYGTSIVWSTTPSEAATQALEFGCTLRRDFEVFAVFPHMHQLGSRMSASLVREGGEAQVFFDEPYSFEEQLNYETQPIEVLKNDTIIYDCSFVNPTGSTVRFGDSSDAEMCVLGMYRYPSQGAISLCID